MGKQTLIYLGLFCFLFPFTNQRGIAFGEPINVLIYSKYDEYPHRYNGGGRLRELEGFTVHYATEISDVNAANLEQFDVFFADTSYENDLDEKADVLQEFLRHGGGIVVGQSNIVSGPINWLPFSLEAFVATRAYPDNGTFALTLSGQSHPIFEGLTTSDLSSRPADTIYTDSLGTGWDVLMVHSTDPRIVGLAAGSFGEGRILLWPDHFATNRFLDPSDRFLDQAFHWVAVPEPTSLALVALGGLIFMRRNDRA